MRIYCIGDPIPDGIRVDPHIGNGEHYHLIHTSPQYRLEQHIRDLEDQLAPPHFPWWEREVTQDAPETLWLSPELTGKPLEMPERISYQLDQLKAQLLHQQNKLNEHLDATKKRKTAGF